MKRERLSWTQTKMLANVRDGRSFDAHCRGMSEYGGADGTLRSLVGRGLLAWVKDATGHTDLVITAAGRATLQDRTKVSLVKT